MKNLFKIMCLILVPIGLIYFDYQMYNYGNWEYVKADGFLTIFITFAHLIAITLFFVVKQGLKNTSMFPFMEKFTNVEKIPIIGLGCGYEKGSLCFIVPFRVYEIKFYKIGK